MHIQCCGLAGSWLAVPDERGEAIKSEMGADGKRAAPALEPDARVNQGKPVLAYGKAPENLIEISFVFASMQAGHEKLCGTDSITWKQMFVDWANEFETAHAGTDWGQDDYLEEIKKYARQKILAYAGLDDGIRV